MHHLHQKNAHRKRSVTVLKNTSLTDTFNAPLRVLGFNQTLLAWINIGQILNLCLKLVQL